MKRSVLFAVVVLLAATATGQIVSPAGTLDVMMSVQQTRIYAHTDGSGNENRNIDVRAISTMVAVEYSLTDRFALGASVPYVQARYRGPSPHPGAIVDDGSDHGTVQDLQLEARYALIRGHSAVTPFVAFRHPTRDYPTMGHAAPGRGLRELEIGVSAGRPVPSVPNAVIAATLGYTHSEAVEGIRVNRTNADLQLGYALGSRVFVRGFGAWQRSHGGIDLPIPPTSEHFHHHDQLARINHTRAGGGLTVTLSDRTNVHVNYSTVVRSVNAHMGRSLGVGTSWTFGPR